MSENNENNTGVVVCPKCNTENKPGDNFCGHCGRSLNDDNGDKSGGDFFSDIFDESKDNAPPYTQPDLPQSERLTSDILYAIPPQGKPAEESARKENKLRIILKVIAFPFIFFRKFLFLNIPSWLVVVLSLLIVLASLLYFKGALLNFTGRTVDKIIAMYDESVSVPVKETRNEFGEKGGHQEKSAEVQKEQEIVKTTEEKVEAPEEHPPAETEEKSEGSSNVQEGDDGRAVKDSGGETCESLSAKLSRAIDSFERECSNFGLTPDVIAIHQKAALIVGKMKAMNCQNFPF